MNQQMQKADEFGLLPVNQSSSLMDVISRAASDPATDVTKLERLLEMYERITAAEARKAYMAALAAVQTELPAIPERGEIKQKGGGVQSTYALWEDINDTIKPVLQKHGLALSFRTGFESGQIAVTGVLSHCDGHCEQTTIHLPTDTSGSKNAVQAVGSSTSYGKRYTAGALLNLTSRGEDDDGKKGGTGAIDETQRRNILDLIERTKADPELFCRYMGVEAIPDIAIKDYDKAIVALNLKEKKVQKQ